MTIWKILAGIINRHGLVVANGLSDKCVGSITRRRVTVDSTEESIIDHVILSEDLVNELEAVHIDEDRNHILTKITKTKNRKAREQKSQTKKRRSKRNGKGE